MSLAWGLGLAQVRLQCYKEYCVASLGGAGAATDGPAGSGLRLHAAEVPVGPGRQAARPRDRHRQLQPPAGGAQVRIHFHVLEPDQQIGYRMSKIE